MQLIRFLSSAGSKSFFTNYFIIFFTKAFTFVWTAD